MNVATSNVASQATMSRHPVTRARRINRSMRTAKATVRMKNQAQPISQRTEHRACESHGNEQPDGPFDRRIIAHMPSPGILDECEYIIDGGKGEPPLPKHPLAR